MEGSPPNVSIVGPARIYITNDALHRFGLCLREPCISSPRAKAESKQNLLCKNAAWVYGLTAKDGFDWKAQS